MSALLAVPILAGLLILQTAVLNQIMLLQGSADIVLLALIAWSLQKRVRTAWSWGIIGALMVGYATAVPFWVYIFSYLAAVGLSQILRQRIWSVPVLAMFITTFVSTLILHGTTMLALRLANKPVDFAASLNLITFPSMLLNLLLALPFYLIFTDLAKLVYPETLEI